MELEHPGYGNSDSGKHVSYDYHFSVTNGTAIDLTFYMSVSQEYSKEYAKTMVPVSYYMRISANRSILNSFLCPTTVKNSEVNIIFPASEDISQF